MVLKRIQVEMNSKKLTAFGPLPIRIMAGILGVLRKLSMPQDNLHTIFPVNLIDD
jgi:hypothetical protein